MSENDLEAAVEIALRHESDANVRRQATAFCEQVKESIDGWRLCLPLFMQEGKRTENARFFALQVLENTLRSRSFELGEANTETIRRSLVEWHSERLKNGSDPDPPFLRNKLATLYSLLFVLLYTTTWRSFFDDFALLIFGSDQITSSTSNARATDFFFRVSVAIEQEIADVLIIRSAEESQRATLIKDEIRRCDMAKLPKMWFALFAQYRDSDKNIVALGLKVIASWASWMDISLIVNESFMSFLFQLLQDSQLRNAACEALVGIVGKKMNVNDKLQLISMLNLPSLMSTLDLDSDPDFTENVARLTNIQSVELSRAISHNTLSAETVVATNLMITNLVPYILRFLANEYDETSAAVFPAVNDILTMLRKADEKDEGSTNLLRSLLEAVVLKMKYDENADWGEEASAIEDAEFMEMRTKLRSYQDIIIQINFQLYTQTIVNLVIPTFETVHNQDWRQVELSMYELFLYGEAVKGFEKSSQAVRDQAQSHLNMMLCKMIETDAYSFSHPSIQDHFFEIIVRYSTYFEENPAHLMKALAAFIDQRGLHNTNARIQQRSWYLFSRFIKLVSSKLGDVGRQVLDAIQDLLLIDVVDPDDMQGDDSDSDADNKIDPFENRLYLFEAVGTIVSAKAVAASDQTQLGHMLLDPLFTNIEKTVSRGVNDKSQSLFLQHNIMAIGRFAQGFPTDSKARSIYPEWDAVFQTASDYILAAFDAQVSQSNIRDASRFAFARIVNVLNERMVTKLPRLVSGMIENSDLAALIDFLPFFGQLVFKMKPSSSEVVNGAMSPLLKRIFQLINTPVEGTDDAIRMSDLRKAYLAFIIVVLNNDMQGVFISEQNQAAFEPFVSSIMHFARDSSDPAVEKLAFSVVRELITAYCSRTVPAGTPTTTNTPLPGFDDFAFSNLVPLCFEVPAKPDFDLRDAQSANVVSEIASVQKQLFAMKGQSYLDHLRDVYFRSVNLPSHSVEQYLKALSEHDSKRFKAFYKNFLKELVA